MKLPVVEEGMNPEIVEHYNYTGKWERRSADDPLQDGGPGDNLWADRAGEPHRSSGAVSEQTSPWTHIPAHRQPGAVRPPGGRGVPGEQLHVGESDVLPDAGAVAGAGGGACSWR